MPPSSARALASIRFRIFPPRLVPIRILPILSGSQSPRGMSFPSLRRIGLAIAVALALSALAPWWAADTNARRGPWLINAQQPNALTRPEVIRDHFAHIDTLPFDGMTISSAPTSRLVMKGDLLSQEAIARDFAPLNGLVFTRLRHNFAVVHVDRPGDFFDDWSVTVENFRRLARVLRAAGIEGDRFRQRGIPGHAVQLPGQLRVSGEDPRGIPGPGAAARAADHAGDRRRVSADRVPSCTGRIRASRARRSRSEADSRSGRTRSCAARFRPG